MRNMDKNNYGAQCLIWFKTGDRKVASLRLTEETLPLLVQPRKTGNCSNITEKLLTTASQQAFFFSILHYFLKA